MSFLFSWYSPPKYHTYLGLTKWELQGVHSISRTCQEGWSGRYSYQHQVDA